MRLSVSLGSSSLVHDLTSTAVAISGRMSKPSAASIIPPISERQVCPGTALMTCGPALAGASNPVNALRMSQVNKSPNAPPEHVDLRIEQPNCSAIYYDNCGMIDRHNRLRQDDLQIERKYVTQLWYQRVNLSLFAMCVMDAYLFYKACTLSNGSPAEFIWKLAAELPAVLLIPQLRQP